MAIHGCIETAGGGEAGELMENDSLLLWFDDGGRVETGVLRDGGIDVKTIDGRVGVGVKDFLGCGTIGCDDGGIKVDRACILTAGQA